MDDLTHGCDADPTDPRTLTRCGKPAARVQCYGPAWTEHRGMLLAFVKGGAAHTLCPTCWPEPVELTCPCCGRPCDKATFDAVVDRLSRELEYKPEPTGFVRIGRAQLPAVEPSESER